MSKNGVWYYGEKSWDEMTEVEREEEREFALACAIADEDTPYGNRCEEDSELFARLQEKFSRGNYGR